MSHYLSRRELLAAFLGAPLAMSIGCGSTRLPPAGEIVGASHRFGHRLRENGLPEPAANDWEPVSVVIVGGGVAGLAAARKLSQSGIDDFVLLELEPDIGGTAMSGESSIGRYPWGAHYLPVPQAGNGELIEFLDSVGFLEGRTEEGAPIVREEYLCRDPEERIFSQGRWHEGLFPLELATTDNRSQLQKFREEVDRWVAWRDGDGRRAFTLPSANSSTSEEAIALDRISFGEWLDQKKLTSPRLRWLTDYACRDDYGLTADLTSAWAGLFYFASRMSRPGEETQPLMTWPDGNGRLVRELSRMNRNRIRTGTLVTGIHPDSASNGKVRVTAIDGGSSGTGLPLGYLADRVIFAAPQFLARRLIEGYTESRPDTDRFEYGAWMVANLHLSDRPRDNGFPLCWDNVIENSPSLGYVVATHQRGVDFGPTVLTYYYPLCDEDPKAARERLLSLEWKDWAEVCLSDLEQAHPDIRPLVQRLDVMRWGHAMVRPRPGFVWSDVRRQSARPFQNVHFAQTDLSGFALFEEAFHHGCRAAGEVMAALRG